LSWLCISSESSIEPPARINDAIFYLPPAHGH
jgi:hypothetical protein